jgi:hypothetical protein
MSLINTLKAGVPGPIPEEHRRELQNARKEYPKHGHEISGWIGNCETSLHSNRKAQRHQAYEGEETVVQGRMHFAYRNKWNQLVSVGRLKVE